MLTTIRQGTNNIFVKIILGLIAFSFVGIGGARFIDGNNGGDIVSFDKVKSISIESFEIAKAREIDALQRQNGINLTEERIAEMGLDNSVLKRLINEAMITYLASHYDFDISEDFVVKLVRSAPFFKNQNGEFDLSIFKNTFRNSPQRENEYLDSMKKQLVTNALLEVFMYSVNTPKAMTDNMVNYMSETRSVDLLSIDLSYKAKDYKAEAIPTEQLNEFYQNNQTLFVLPELRSFDYIKTDRASLIKKIEITEPDLKQFFEDNRDDFTAKDFDAAKKQVREAFITERLEKLTSELAKNFEEDVSSGLTLQEISQKYELTISSAQNMSLSAMNSSSVPEHVELADNVFEMIENEVSYPIEVASKNEILLIKLTAITPLRQQSFSEVEQKIKDLVQKKMLAIANIRKLEELRKNYNPEKIDKNNLKAQGINLVSNKSFTRADLPSQEKLPVALLKSMFTTDKTNSTAVIIEPQKAYIAYVKTVGTNKTRASSLKKDFNEHFSNTIKEGLFQELIFHLTQRTNMKILQGAK